MELTETDIERAISALAVEIYTELSRAQATDRTVADVVQMNAHSALQFIRSNCIALCAMIRTPAEGVCLTDTERTSFEQSLQRLEAELRQKAKVSSTQTEFELSLQLSEAKKALSSPVPRPATKDCATNTESEARGQSEVGKALISDDFLREEREKMLKTLLASQVESKRDQQVIADLERKVSRLEVDLLEMSDSLQDKTRECDKWRKECEILNLTAKKDSLGAMFTESRRKLTRRRFDSHSLSKFETPTAHCNVRRHFSDLRTSSYSPAKQPYIRRENSMKGLQSMTPGNAQTLTDAGGELVFGKAIQILRQRNSSVRDLRRAPLLRKQTAPTKCP